MNAANRIWSCATTQTAARLPAYGNSCALGSGSWPYATAVPTHRRPAAIRTTVKTPPMGLLFPTFLGAIFGRDRCGSLTTAGRRGCSCRGRWFPEFGQRDPVLPGHIVAHPLESERPFVGHGLPPVLLGELALPGLHLGVGHAFRNPPEPHTVWVELHPLGLAELPGARLDRLSVLAVTGRAIDVDVFDPFENLFALGDDLFISPPPGRHVLVGILWRSRRRGLDGALLCLAPRQEHSNTPDHCQRHQTVDLHNRPQAPFLSALICTPLA